MERIGRHLPAECEGDVRGGRGLYHGPDGAKDRGVQRLVKGREARRQPMYVVTVRGTRQSASMLIFLCIVFVLSGAAGLIYESIWTRYLGLFVGHSAYAQVLVLVIFLGGMSAGLP